MAEIKTFSSAVDAIASQTGRPELRTRDRIERYVRQTYRECSGLQIFFRDMVEDQITAGANDYVWTLPKNFRIMRTVKYPIARFEIQFPPMIPPGRAQRDHEFYYYAGPGYYVFVGSVKDDIISIAYYVWPAFLKYYETGERPAYFDDDTTSWWLLQANDTYAEEGSNDDNLTPEQAQAAKEKVTNWLIFDWWDTVIEGGSTKTFNFLDDPRAPKSFSLYKGFQKTLTEGEPYDSLER